MSFLSSELKDEKRLSDNRKSFSFKRYSLLSSTDSADSAEVSGTGSADA